MNDKGTSHPAAAGNSDSATTFFRQGGWLVIATVSSGVFMTGVQMVANVLMTRPEYLLWFALLRIFLLMSIPSAGLQIVFAQQTAAAITDRQHAQLARTVRASFMAMFIIWLIMATIALVGQRHWISLMGITNPAALWMTALLGLASLWSPIVKGVLQGFQNFKGLGWVLIIDGVGRFAAILLILWLGGQAAGGMGAALIGQGVSVLVGVWLIRFLLKAHSERQDWIPWLRRVVPLTLGIGSVQFMFNADVPFVKAVYADTTLYMPAAMIGLAMVTFTTPLAAVMFPKVVRSTALTQGSRGLQRALGATLLLGGVAALACTILPRLPLRIIYLTKPAYWNADVLVPWFTWCLLPLIVANVLVSNLLARDRFAVVPWIVLIAVGYGLALWGLKPYLRTLDEMAGFRTVVQTLGVFGLLLLVVAALFTWRDSRRVGSMNPSPV